MKSVLDKFEKEAEKGILCLLTAFYFRQHGFSGGEKTFEFTHKSFGEYLTSVRLVKQLIIMSKELDLNGKEYDRGWNIEDALKKWVGLTGPTAIDNYLYDFIKDEIKNKNIDEIKNWQRHLAKLISCMLHTGVPMLEPRRNILEEIKLFRNSSEALLILHAACASITLNVSQIHTPNNSSFGTWMSILQPQRSGPRNVVGYNCFIFLDFSRQIFHVKDLYNIKFHHSTFIKTDFIYANLIQADFIGADLSDADLRLVVMRDANLEDARLTGARLMYANLTEVNLKGAKLQGANLTGVDLTGADLRGADLTDVDLTDANLTDTNLAGANLTGANLTQSDFTGANLTGANFTGTNFTKAKSIFNS